MSEYTESMQNLLDAAESVFAGNPVVAQLVASVLGDVNDLEQLADSEDPDTAFAAGMALATITRAVSRSSDRHFDRCMKHVRQVLLGTGPAPGVGVCVVCGRTAPLDDGECPDCRH